eukprot:12132222-Karenia_brevis.AAC.1
MATYTQQRKVKPSKHHTALNKNTTNKAAKETGKDSGFILWVGPKFEDLGLGPGSSFGSRY